MTIADMGPPLRPRSCLHHQRQKQRHTPPGPEHCVRRPHIRRLAVLWHLPLRGTLPGGVVQPARVLVLLGVLRWTELALGVCSCWQVFSRFSNYVRRLSVMGLWGDEGWTLADERPVLLYQSAKAMQKGLDKEGLKEKRA